VADVDREHPNAVCRKCGETYHEHPHLIYEGWASHPFCEGDIAYLSDRYEDGLKCSWNGRKVPDMHRAELIEFIGHLDAIYTYEREKACQ
jgi:hypothetical protein